MIMDKYDVFKLQILSEFPNLSNDELTQLAHFMTEKRVLELVSEGYLSPKQATDPEIAALASQIASEQGKEAIGQLFAEERLSADEKMGVP